MAPYPHFCEVPSTWIPVTYFEIQIVVEMTALCDFGGEVMRSPGASACASWNAWPGGSLSHHVGSLTTTILPFCEEAQANHVDRLCGERATVFGWPQLFYLSQLRH